MAIDTKFGPAEFSMRPHNSPTITLPIQGVALGFLVFGPTTELSPALKAALPDGTTVDIETLKTVLKSLGAVNFEDQPHVESETKTVLLEGKAGSVPITLRSSTDVNNGEAPRVLQALAQLLVQPS